jgi:hypothetical protein
MQYFPDENGLKLCCRAQWSKPIYQTSSSISLADSSSLGNMNSVGNFDIDLVSLEVNGGVTPSASLFNAGSSIGAAAPENDDDVITDCLMTMNVKALAALIIKGEKVQME